ncbi:MAG TPA: hypothetical protein VIH34_04220 [Candidatus Bathyarchaeia archaeon]
MPKATGIPKSVLADINRLKTRLNSLEKTQSSLTKEFKSSMKAQMDAMKKHEATLAQMGKKAVKREKRKPSPYNLFLKDKMSSGMSMIEAVKAWKARGSGTSSSPTRQSSQEWPQTTQQY